MHRRLCTAFLLAAAAGAPAGAQTLDTETFITGLSRPVWVGGPPGDERLFIAEQLTGLIKVYSEGSVLPTPFLDLGAAVAGAAAQQGFLSMVFHPKYAQNGYFYVTYTTAFPDSVGIVSRFQVSADDPNVADPASELVLLEIEQQSDTHNPEHLEFGPLDGYLYIFSGDGGGPNDPGCDAQNSANLLGKMLRIDVDKTDPGLNYAIPPDNPFVGQPGVAEEIWSLGWRNVWRFSFDKLTGDMYLADVGQAGREEISFEPALTAGRNYGWPIMEGDLCNAPGIASCIGVNPPLCFDAAYTDPAFLLNHPNYAVIVGGVVYRGCAMPELQGTYFFADRATFSYFTGEMSGGVLTNVVDRSAELNGAGNAVHFAEDKDGELLVAALSSGRVSRIVPVTPPTIVDCDGDGFDDDCEMATYAYADMDQSGVLDTCEAFDVDTANVCVSLGGLQTMRLHPGATHAGEVYLILGSVTGTSPGIPFGSFVLPVNFDAYTQFTITNGNVTPLLRTVGILDSSGEATAFFDAPAGLLPPGVVGLTAHHAFVTANGTGTVTSTSNATSVTFDA